MKGFQAPDYMQIILDQEEFIKDLPRGLNEDILKFCDNFPKVLDDLRNTSYR